MHSFVGREGRQSIWGILIADAMILMIIMRWTSKKKLEGTKITISGPVRMYVDTPYITILYIASAASLLRAIWSITAGYYSRLSIARLRPIFR